MAISASDLKAWGSVGCPEDDTSSSGGAIQDDNHASGGVRVQFTQPAATDEAEVLSDGADTRTITVTGRLASGAIDSEALVLNGTTPVTGTKAFERILKAVASAKDGTRTVTVRRADNSAEIGIIGPNVLSFRIMFYDAASESGQATRYELVYLQNDHGTLTLNAAKVKLSSDPQSRLHIALANAVGDVSAVSNRKTEPGSIGSWTDDNVDVSVPGNALAAQGRIAVWLRQQLPASDPAFKNTWQLTLAGTTAP